MKKDIFANWREDQEVYDYVPINSMPKHLKERNINRLEDILYKSIAELLPVAAMFSFKDISEFLQDYKFPNNTEVKKRFYKIYDLLEKDVTQFIDYLKDNNLCSINLDNIEEKQGINRVAKKYTDMLDILFRKYGRESNRKEEFLFAVANRFFEFCFSAETFDKFKKMLKNNSDHPILRMIYAAMWANLAEVGWQHWHLSCINNLKKDFESGKEIVYIAGGTDVYQLIKSGIYNIRVIDPILPTQPKYYSQNWDWFIKDNSNIKKKDEVEINLDNIDNKIIIMRRDKFELTGKKFSVKLSNNKKIKIEESLTTWGLYDKKNKNKLGNLIFDRRLTGQEDFELNKNNSILISFNELYFIAAPQDNDGWGINPSKFDSNLKIHVKQLRNSVNKKVVQNMRYEIKQTDFAFITLGSCVD